MGLKIELFDEGKMIRLFVNKELLNILMESSIMYLSAVQKSYQLEKNEENRKSIEVTKELMLDIMLHNTYAYEKEIKFELDLKHFTELKNVVVCSVDVMEKGKNFKDKVKNYIEFGKDVEIAYKEYSKGISIIKI